MATNSNYQQLISKLDQFIRKFYLNRLIRGVLYSVGLILLLFVLINVLEYYFYFDTVVNRYLIETGALDLDAPKQIGLVVDTGCAYFATASFPDDIVAGLRVAKLGNSSVRYEIGLFRNAETTACAQGHFVHVYVDAQTRRPVAIGAAMREGLAKVLV